MANIAEDIEAPARPAREPQAVPHPTPEERAARGKAARADVPRSVHGAWEPAGNRRDPVELGFGGRQQRQLGVERLFALVELAAASSQALQHLQLGRR